MNSLVFLLVRSTKNSFLELLRKPAKLAMWVLVIGGMVGLFVLTMFNTRDTENFADLVWLKGSLFSLILIFAIIAVQKGLSNGDVIFDMNDVNLLFVSPVSSRKILMYGILRMAKMAFLAGFFILFQSNTLGANFGVGFSGVLIVFGAFIIAVSVLQILSLLIYSISNGKPKRKRAVRLIAAAVLLPCVVSLATEVIKIGEFLAGAAVSLNGQAFTWTPIVGWAAEGVIAFIAGDFSTGFLFFGLIVLTGFLMILYIAFSNPDYYEDVLVATETTFEKKRSLAEGQINGDAGSAKKVKIKGTGVKGYGASTLFYKHWRESFRANVLGFWGISSIIVVCGAILMAFFIRKAGESGMLILLQTLMWLQIFMIGTGRGLKELYMHYIYLIPDSSLRKILWSNFEIGFRVLIESIVIFLGAGLILKASLVLILSTAAVYTMFSFLLLGINYLSLRWTGADISSGMLVLLYLIAVILIMAPGLAGAFAVGIFLGGMLAGLWTLLAWELAVALGCFALSIGVLHRCDMPVLKTGK